MTRPLHILLDGALDGPTNMARDEALLVADELRPAAIRIYTWSPPTISLGYFQVFDQVAGLPSDVRDLAIVRRLTGGGAILHDREITYCLVADETVPAANQAPTALYRIVHQCWRDALAATGVQSELAPDEFPLPTPRSGPFFCFEKPGRTDLIIGDQKLLGSAQRRVPGRVLQHGSLLLAKRFESHPGVDLGDPHGGVVRDWIEDFLARLSAALELTRTPSNWSATLLRASIELREKYAGVAWTRRR